MQLDVSRPAHDDAVPGPLSDEDRRMLAEIGFLAIVMGMPEPARRIFDALPAHPKVRVVKAVGQAMSAVLSGKADDAVRLLRDGELSRQPGDPDLTSFLAVALLASGRQQQAVQLLEPLARGQGGASCTPLHQQTAQRLLDKLARPGAQP